MDAGKQSLLKFMRLDHQLSIPIYQRKYSWTDKECNQLFKDILRVGKDEQEHNHFIGSIVYMNEGGHISKLIDELMVIDGQQRITTISLLISAMADYLINNPNCEFEYPLLNNPQKLIDYYLLNDMGDEKSKYKLILTNEDKTTLIKILDNLQTNEKVQFNNDDSKRVYENYTFFMKKINADNIEYLFKGLEKLLIIYVALEHNIDNPQLIFESLNSTGLELNQADLIRNYILMGLVPKEQEKLYNTYWRKIEKLFENYKSWVFDKFIRDYLTIKTDRTPAFKRIYSAFKDYSNNFDDVEVLVKDVYKFAIYLSCIAFGKEKNQKLKEALDSLEFLEYDVTYPYTLSLYRDYDEGKLTSDEFIEIIKYTESYLLRRLICGIPTVSLNKTFAKMYNEIDKENYLESYKAVLLLKEDYKRMPNNEEFRRSWIEKNIYNLRSKNREYIFDKFENWNSKEKTPIQNYTIEHIMPQNPNLSEEWKEDLGPNYEEIQDKYLHTIGNLTLTGYNSELSDKPFTEKRDMAGGFKQSAIRLNIGLHDLETWNEEEIQKRTNYLIEESFKIWKYPNLSDEILEKYTPKSKSKRKSADESELSDLDIIKLNYWKLTSEIIDKEYDIFKSVKPGPRNYYDISMGTNLAHITLTLNTQAKYVKSLIWIPDSHELFNYLYSLKDEIELELGLELEWKKLRKAARIGFTYEVDIKSDYKWEESIKWQLNMAEKLYSVFYDRIKEF